MSNNMQLLVTFTWDYNRVSGASLNPQYDRCKENKAHTGDY